MKLLVDVRTMASRPSGVGMYIFSFLKQFLKHKEIEIILVSDVIESREIKYFQTLGNKIYEYGRVVNKSIGVYPYFIFLQKIIRKESPDFFWEPNNVFPVRLRNPNGRILLTIHDVFPLMLPECFSRVYRAYFKYTIKKAVKYADLILYDSEETRKNTEFYIHESKLKDSFVAYVIVDKMKSYHICDDEYFLYIGNLEKRKGTDILLRAYQKYRTAGGEKKLYLAGKMRDSEIEELYNNLKNAVQGIEYLGYIETEEKMKLYSKCSCFIFPSRNEGFGMPPIEAMQYGKSIIVSDLPIFKEILGEAVNYVSIKKDDMFAEELANQMFNYRKADLESYKFIVDRFSGEQLGERCIKMLKEHMDIK